MRALAHSFTGLALLTSPGLMFGFLRRKKPASQTPETPPASTEAADQGDAAAGPAPAAPPAPAAEAPAPSSGPASWFSRWTGGRSSTPAPAPAPAVPAPPAAPASSGTPAVAMPEPPAPAQAAEPAAAPVTPPAAPATAPIASPPAPAAPVREPAAPAPSAVAPAPAPLAQPLAPAAESATARTTVGDAANPVPTVDRTAAPAPAAPAPTVPAAPRAEPVPPPAEPATMVTSVPAAQAVTEPSQPSTDAAVAEETELVVEPPESRAGWMARLRQGLTRTRGQLAGLFGFTRIDEALFEDLETALLVADTGVETTTWLLERLRERVKRERLETGEDVRRALHALLVELLSPLEAPIDIDRAQPLVWMVAGVNGAGKTTSIGKLAHLLRREQKSVLLAAGDTFRAAAREQLAEWGARNDVAVIAQSGGDPGAVAFDAVSAGIARRTGVVIVDTAGRLPTQTHLMEELRKVRRVIGKAMAGAPHEALLVLDGNTGQNMLAQVAAFDAAISLTGLVVTKLDGTAKGGALAALAHTRRERPIPVYFIGVGESVDDLQAFSADEFVTALLGPAPAPR